MEEFRRLTRLPAYVFNITSELKAAARRRGEDIIDFGMGNPDGPTPKHIVDKLIEAVQRTTTHRYSLWRGVPRLRKTMWNWIRRPRRSSRSVRRRESRIFAWRCSTTKMPWRFRIRVIRFTSSGP